MFKNEQKLDKQNALIKVSEHAFYYRIGRLILRGISLWILYIRSWFIKDQTVRLVTIFIPLVTIAFIFLNKIYPNFFTYIQNIYFFIYIGSQLLVYDTLGSKISENILTSQNPLFSTTTLIVLAHNKNPIIRHIFRHVNYSAMFMGKTPMSAAGRAALIAGVFTGISYSINAHLDRTAANQRTALDRAAADQRAAADRAAAAAAAAAKMPYDIWQTQHHTWDKQHERWESRWWRGPEPVPPKPPKSPE
jgi:hypothetical protein